MDNDFYIDVYRITIEGGNFPASTLCYAREDNICVYQQWTGLDDYPELLGAIEELVSYAIFEGNQLSGAVVLGYYDHTDELCATWEEFADEMAHQKNTITYKAELIS